MERRHPTMLTVLLTLCIAAGFACNAEPDTSGVARRTRATSTRHNVEIGYSALRISLPIFVAQERGMFADRGLRVTLKRYDTAQPLVDEVLDGRMDAGGYAAFAIILNAAARDSSSLHVTSAMVEDVDHPVSRLLVRRGSDIRDVAALRAKTIGYLPTIAYQHWLQLVLRRNGIDPATVECVPLPPQQQISALADGAVDALFTGDPMAAAALATGVGEYLDTAPVPRALGRRVMFGTFMFSNQFVAQHSDVAQQIIDALDDAIAFIAREPAHARTALEPYMRPNERSWTSHFPPASYAPSSAFTNADLAREAADELSLGMLANPPDTRGWVVARRSAQ